MRVFFVAILMAALVAGCGSAPPLATSGETGAQQVESHGWAPVGLPGKRNTQYAKLIVDGRKVVHARSESAASFLRRPVRFEPDQLRAVRFSWRVQELIAAADLNDRDHSDSPVRVILAFDGDHSRLSMKNRMAFELAHTLSGETPPFATLMYVWDNRAAPETIIHSGRTDRIRKIVVESGPARLGKWQQYERDIVADYVKTFGELPGRLISVGLMTDSDNTRSKAEAWYGDIHFVAPDPIPR